MSPRSPGLAPASSRSDLPVLSCVSPKASVRGTLVDGLTSDDVDRLSAFEGPEYAIAPLAVDAFGPAQTRESGGSIDVLGELPQDLRGQRVEARAYVWIAGEHLLESEPWECVLLPGRPLGWSVTLHRQHSLLT